jgi:hypothetical protein
LDSFISPRFVVILPITHTPPDNGTVGVEIPAKVRQAIGLDDAPSWVIVSDHNVDEWPNGGLAPVPGRPTGRALSATVSFHLACLLR